MILISGTNLTPQDLPNSEIMGYQIELEKMPIKLKTVAKSLECFQIYIAENLRTEYTITDEIAPKIIYFKDDADLIDKLNNNTQSNYVDPFADTVSEEPAVEVPAFEPPAPTVDLEKKDETEIEKNTVEEKKSLHQTDGESNSDNSVIPSVDIEEVNSDLPDSFTQIPNLGDDTDSLKELVNTKDRIIAQKDGMIKELKTRIEESYKAQEIQLTEVEDMWKEKLSEAQGIIADLQGQSLGVALDEETTNFLKFIRYAQSNKAVVKEGFSESEYSDMGALNSQYTVFACGSGDSSYSMLKQVKSYIEKSPDCIVLDFSNDNFLTVSFKIKPSSSNTMSLLNYETDPLTLLKDVKGTRFIPSTNYNDISLLNVDWGKMMRRIDDMASGKPVLMLFGSINNFSVRYTVSKLATIMPLFVFAKCSPVILSALYTDVKFIPKERVNIVAVEYIEVVKNILSEIAKTYNVVATNNEVDWSKLGLSK